MSQGQVNDEFLSQIGDFTGAEANIALAQLGHQLLLAPVAQEQPLAGKHHDIVAKVAMGRCQALEIL